MPDQRNAATSAFIPTPNQPATYSVKAIATRFDLHVSTVYRLVESGALKALRIGKSIRIPAESLAAYLAACEQATTCECGFPAPSTEAVEVSR